MNRILAVDPGLKFGWALYDSGIITSGVWDLNPPRYTGGGMTGVILLRNLRIIGKVDLVGFEEVRSHKGAMAAHKYGGITHLLWMWCEQNETPYEPLPVGEIKRLATGKGNCGKPEMIEACINKLGHTPKDDNEADARWGLQLLLERETIA